MSIIRRIREMFRLPVIDLAVPGGGIVGGPDEDYIESSYWIFDARRKGYGQWKRRPMSERDAFKAELRNAIHKERLAKLMPTRKP